MRKLSLPLCAAISFLLLIAIGVAQEIPLTLDVPVEELMHRAVEAPAEDGTYVIAVVEDGPCRYFEQLLALVEQELNVLVGDEVKVSWRPAQEFNAGWKVERVGTVLQNALNHPEVDLVFAAGILVAQAATYEDIDLVKPVISGFVQDPDAVGLPYDEHGRSTRENFNFVVIPLRSTRDIAVFHEMIGFKRLGIIVDEVLIRGLEQLEGEGHRAMEGLGVEIAWIPMNLSAEEVLEQIDETVEAIYLTPPMRMPEEEWRKVIDGVNAKGLPSFSLLGHKDVEIGALAGLAPEAHGRLARRLALNIQQIMEGTPPEELQVPMAMEEKLTMNAKTALQIGYSPSLDLMMSGMDMLYEEVLDTGNPLTLEQAVTLALENSAAQAISKATVESSRQDRNLALSALLPQVAGNVTYAEVDSDRAEASAGTLAKDATTAGITASQILFNDLAFSGYRAVKSYYLGALNEAESTRLDVIAAAARSYIQLLQAEALLEIELDNFGLTRRNLELARIRHQVGTAGPEEVYRWEAEVASQRAMAIAAESLVETARVALNQVLGVPINTRWKPKDIQFAADDFYFLGVRLNELLSTDEKISLVEPFTVQMALRNAPELRALDKSIEAQRILLGRARRRYIAPEVSASFTYDHKMDENFVGETLPSGADDDDWMVGVQASLPLFEGAGRHFDIAQARAELKKLEETRRRVAELVEQQARSVGYSLNSSWPNMALQNRAAEFSQKNLDVIREKYARGLVSILDLLDAQNQSFVANQNAAIAVYSYLEDLVEWQRVMCWFEAEQTEAAKDTWAAELRAFQEERLSRGK